MHSQPRLIIQHILLKFKGKVPTVVSYLLIEKHLADWHLVYFHAVWKETCFVDQTSMSQLCQTLWPTIVCWTNVCRPKIFRLYIVGRGFECLPFERKKLRENVNLKNLMESLTMESRSSSMSEPKAKILLLDLKCFWFGSS